MNTDWLYRSGGSEPLPRNVSDLKDALQGIGLAGKKENVVVVATRDEAQLIVEVNAVRTAGMADADTLNDQFWIIVLIKRGPRLSPAQFAAVPLTYRFPEVTRLAAPTTTHRGGDSRPRGLSCGRRRPSHCPGSSRTSSPGITAR